MDVSCCYMQDNLASTGFSQAVRALEESRHCRQRAERLLRDYGCLLSSVVRDAVLVVQERGLGLAEIDALQGKDPGSVYLPDWSRMDISSPWGKRSGQPLLRAVEGKRRRKGLLIWDLTAGWGEDAWLLAALGHGVLAWEKSLPVYLCLADAWSRVGLDHLWAALRILPQWGDAIIALHALKSGEKNFTCPDVIYMDPLFPAVKGRKGKERKAMRILRLAAQGGEGDPEEMLWLSLRLAGRRVVVKRPRKGQALSAGGNSPVHSVWGRGFRYDIYIPDRQKR